MYQNCIDEVDHDTVDPRVQIELEILNSATDEINRLEVELDEARSDFRQTLCDSTAKIDALRLKLGLCVERAKPYYEARFCANEALKQTQTAASKYEKTNGAHCAAREMVYLAEQGLGGRTLDPAWQEMLNHATQRVNDAERDRGVAASEHRFACIKHEAASAKVQSLQKELKRAIAKSSLSIRRSLMTMSSIMSRHELMFLPYYEMKAHFNNILEQHKSRINDYESQVSTQKLTYADALRNLEQISDEIHQTRRKVSMYTVSNNSVPSKQVSIDSNESFLDDAQEIDEYKCLPHKLDPSSCSLNVKMEEIEGYKNVDLNNVSQGSQTPQSEKQDAIGPRSHSSEWIEINLDNSSPDGEVSFTDETIHKQKLVKQKTLPNPPSDNEFSVLKTKMKLDTNISNWISRSSAKNEEDNFNRSRRQSLDNILGPTSEKVKEMFSHGMMILNISSLTERRNSEPKAGITEEKSKPFIKKIPSPLEKTLTYLTADEDNSDTESLSSVDMLNEEQINSLMLDKEIETVCEQLLGTPISEIVYLPHCASTSHPNN